MAFFSAAEPFRVANRLAERTIYRCAVYSYDGAQVDASNGMGIVVDRRLDNGALDDPPHILVVCAGFDTRRAENPHLLSVLRRMHQNGVTLGALDTGTHVLAKAGLVRDQRVTMHWEAVPAFREEFPEIEVSDELFEIQPRLMTCAGGTAGLDMMLDLIARQHGPALAAAISDQFIHNHIRRAGDHQRPEPAARIGTTDTAVLRGIEYMERTLEQPVALAALAATVGVTQRQLERRFSRALAVSPGTYYRELRLQRARQLLRDTDLAITEIAVATGYSSLATFSRCYKGRFACSPRADRHAAQKAEIPSR